MKGRILSRCTTWIRETLGRAWNPPAWVWEGPGNESPERPSRFQGLFRWWVVEWTFAWLRRQWRVSKDHGEQPETDEAWI